MVNQMRAFVFSLLAIIAVAAHSQEQYTLDSIQSHFDRCAAEGKVATAPTLHLTVNSRVGHIGRLVGNYSDTTNTFRVAQQISEGTLVTVNYYRSSVYMEMEKGNLSSVRPIGGTNATVGPFLFKSPEFAGLQTDAVFNPVGIWEITGSLTYNTAGGATRTVLVIEPLEEGKIDLPTKMPHRFLHQHQARDWKKAGGDLLARGVYVGYRGGSVWIMDGNNDIIKEPLARLSSSDQTFLRKEIKEGRREWLIPELEKELKETANRKQ
jgi:hypothetical protein